MGLLCVYVGTLYINMISVSPIAYCFSSPFGTMEWERIRNQIFWPVQKESRLHESTETA